MSKSNYLLITLVMVCLLSLAVPAGGVQANEQPPELAVNMLPASLNSGADGNTLLQFTSAGHVLGFGSQSVYLAGLDHALRIEFSGSRPVMPVAEGQGTGQAGVAPLGKVTYRDAWNNIDVIYSAAAGGITESTYVIRPGGSPVDISLRYNTPVQLTPSGSLRFDFQNGYMVEKAPVAWQEIGGQRVDVAVSFRLQGESQVNFDLGSYNNNYAVYIDPTYIWHTFYGSVTDTEIAYGIALDSSGNVYIAGQSGATWNGPGAVAPLRAFTGGYDITIVKLNSAGAYQWHTFYGGTASDMAYGIALDSSANIYVAGVSGATWNGPSGELPKHDYTVNADTVILKLNSAGLYQWHTFYDSDKAYCIALDSSANVYVAGYSTVTWNGPSGQAPLNTFGGSDDIVVIKLNSSGAYQWHTFYGTTHYEEVYGIAVDSSANVYVAGRTEVTWNGPLGELPKHDVGGGLDIFVLKLNSAGAYQWHTFYGSSGRDEAYCIALDSSANVYVAGYSNATWNGPAGQLPLHAIAGNYDIAILKLNNAGAYQWHTFYGSVSANETAYGITLDSSANVYVAGYSAAGWGSPWNAYSGGEDITMVKLNSSGAYQNHAFFGSAAGWDRAHAIAVSSPSIYVAGYSSATWNGPGAAAPLKAYAGQWDLVLVKVSDDVPPTITSFTPTTGCTGTSVIITGTNFTGATAVSFGGIAASSFIVNSATQITAIVGTGAMGRITVTASAGTGTSTLDFIMSCPGTDAFSSSSTAGITTALTTPADVRITTLNVQPQSVAGGQPVEILANVSNRGNSRGTYTATLKINGNIEEVKSGNIGGNVAVPVRYTIYRDQPGTYEVDLNGQKTYFTVTGTLQNTPLDARIIVAAILGALLLLTAVILIRRFAPR